MMFRTAFLAGAAVGYVLGAKAGRERYEQIRGAWRRVSESPAVRERAESVRERGVGLAETVRDTVKGKAGEVVERRRERHADAPGPVTVPPG